MPDITDILHALDEADRRLYAQIRTRMRGAYLQGLVEIVGIHNHTENDDMFLDLIDIKIATLFDRAGHFDHSQGKLNTETANKIEADVKAEGKEVSKGQAVLNMYAGNGQKEVSAASVKEIAGTSVEAKPWPKAAGN